MSLDEEGRRIIAQRNGQQLGASKKQLSAEDAALLTRMRTNRQARAVLGLIAQYLRRGYEIAQTVPSFISPIDGTKMAAESMRSLLDSNNRWAQKVYAAIPDDDAPVSDLNRKKVTLALTQTRSSLALVSSSADDLNRGLAGALADLLTDKLPPWLRPSAPTRDLALKIGLGVALLAGLFLAGKLVYRIMLGGTTGTLGEAENAAVALMDAQRRRRRAGRLRS